MFVAVPGYTCTHLLTVLKLFLLWGYSIYISVAQLVASMSGVVLGGVVEVVGSNLAGGKIFTASICSVDALYPSTINWLCQVSLRVLTSSSDLNLLPLSRSTPECKSQGVYLYLR